MSTMILWLDYYETQEFVLIGSHTFDYLFKFSILIEKEITLQKYKHMP